MILMIINRNYQLLNHTTAELWVKPGMVLRQKLLKWVYPFLMKYRKFSVKNKSLEQVKRVVPGTPFYDLSATLNNGQQLTFENFKNKSVLIVNTASNCGYTNQYAELQKLHEKYKNKLIILAFPSNDFKQQEKGNDEEIARFCDLNFGISFPLAKKAVVVKEPNQNTVFEWLTHKELNGWNDQQPGWNFSKYVINGRGQLTHYFDAGISPLSSEFIQAVTKGFDDKV
jgi:glutathione peroxidase